MQRGRGGMGSRKHGKSGHAGHSPRFVMKTKLEVDRLAVEDAERAARRRPNMASTFAELFGRKPK